MLHEFHLKSGKKIYGTNRFQDTMYIIFMWTEWGGIGISPKTF